MPHPRQWCSKTGDGLTAVQALPQATDGQSHGTFGMGASNFNEASSHVHAGRGSEPVATRYLNRTKQSSRDIPVPEI